MARLFISYARQDQVFVRKLAADLQALGADIWLDVQDIAPGTKWSSAIQTGLDASEIMLVIVTPNSMSSTNVEDEWQYYLEQHKPVIPVLLERARMHFRLSPIQYVDFNMQPYEGGLRQLHERLKSLGIALQPVTDEFLAASRHLSPRPQSQPAASVPAGKKPQSAATRRSRGALIIGAGLLLVLIVAGIIVIPGVTSHYRAADADCRRKYDLRDFPANGHTDNGSAIHACSNRHVIGYGSIHGSTARNHPHGCQRYRPGSGSGWLLYHGHRSPGG